MKHIPPPTLGWLLQRARWVGAVCPSLIVLYSRNALRKKQFFADACRIMESEQVLCLTDGAWQQTLSPQQERVRKVEHKRERSIHFLLFQAAMQQRRYTESIAHSLNLFPDDVRLHLRLMGFPVRDKRTTSVRASIPFNLPPPPSQKEMEEYILQHGAGTQETAQYLSSHNLRLLCYCANRFRSLIRRFPELDEGDLIQEGWFGLYNAARYYDPSRTQFSSYACTAILNQMRVAIKRLLRPHQREEQLGKKALRRLKNIADPHAILNEPQHKKFKQVATFALELSKDKLNDRQQNIIQARFELNDTPHKTLVELGRKHGVTKERIRQIEIATLNKMCKHIMAEGITAEHVFD